MATSAAPDTSPVDFVDLTLSLCNAQALLTGLELGLFTALHAAPADAATIRSRLGLAGRGLSDWLDLLVCNGLLERDGERYRNTPAADRYLVRNSPAYTGEVLQRRLFPALSGLTESLRTGRPHAGEEFMEAVHGLDVLRHFANQMDHITEPLAPLLIKAYDGWERHGSVLDVGGCRGNVVSHILAAHPHLTGQVFDLPTLAPLFEEKAAQRGMTGRMTFHPGDFLTDPLPPADLVLIGHVLVNWDAERRGLLIRKAFDCLTPGGALLVYDRMLTGSPGDTESANLRVSLSMLLVTTGGSSYTFGHLCDQAAAAGFADVGRHRLGAHDTLAVCRKPA
ncbi:methyltransferase [Streptomyces aidingensis]|uniref:Dimerisation domain-containing protein n=1 Tax=Streptomyces aidingensis TaxID=910347 RepID=A0A1I1SL60_9ACTN|nr:methyltransferase [Streptomyces aidingensis]SFD47215.1 Dimerisation domain-containing protein [Streptomyces aidingensis]